MTVKTKVIFVSALSKKVARRG